MTRLSSIAEIRMGATLRGRDATRPDPNGRFQQIRIGDISQDGDFGTGDFVRIEPRESVSSELFLRPGDVLFPNRGTRTTAAVFELEEKNVIVGAQFFILRPIQSKVLPRYLAWFLRTENAARYFDEHRAGTYVQLIQKSDLAALEMPLPSLSAQQTIVAAAALAVHERRLSEHLAQLKWKLVNDQLSQAASTIQIINSPEPGNEDDQSKPD